MVSTTVSSCNLWAVSATFFAFVTTWSVGFRLVRGELSAVRFSKNDVDLNVPYLHKQLLLPNIILTDLIKLLCFTKMLKTLSLKWKSPRVNYFCWCYLQYLEIFFSLFLNALCYLHGPNQSAPSR